MKRFFSAIMLTTLILAALAAIAPAQARNRRADRQNSSESADTRLADHIYLEALRQNLQGKKDAFYELVDYARQLNPDDKFLGMEIGLYYMQLDSSGIDRGLALMDDYVRENPDDLYKNYFYATLLDRFGRNDRSLEIWQSLHNRFPAREALTYRYAQALQASGDNETALKAIAVYDSLETSGADPLDIAGRKSGVFYQTGDTLSILNTARSLLTKSPDNPDYNIYVGQIYQTFLDSDSALYFFNRALELAPDNGMAYYAKANYYNHRNDSLGYDRETFNALQQPNLDVEVKLAILHDYVSNLYTDTLQQPRITELFAELEKQHPHEPMLHDLYCDYLTSIKDFKGAARQLSLSVDLEPSNPQKWVSLSALYFQSKEYDLCADAARRGRHFFPDNFTLAEMEANGYMLTKDYDKAMATTRRAIEKADSLGDNSVLSDLYGLLADCLYRKKEIKESMEAYDKALAYNPENYSAMNNLAYNMACEGIDLDRALTLADCALSASPSSVTVLDTYAWVLFKRKDYSEARNAIDRLLEEMASPDNPDTDPSAEVYEHAGDIYFMSGDPDEAIDFWNDALELDPDNEMLRKKVTHKTYFFK